MISALLPDFWPYILAGLAALGVAIMAALRRRRLIRDTKKAMRTEAWLEAAETYRDTREQMDNAYLADDPHDAAKFLRERKPRAGKKT